jgi:hypothetical protein
VLRHGVGTGAAPGSIVGSSPAGIKLAKSTVQAIEYLIKQNDPARLRIFLAKHTSAERLAIKQQFERDK